MLEENSARPSPELPIDLTSTTGYLTRQYFFVDEAVEVKTEGGLFCNNNNSATAYFVCLIVRSRR